MRAVVTRTTVCAPSTASARARVTIRRAVLAQPQPRRVAAAASRADAEVYAEWLAARDVKGDSLEISYVGGAADAAETTRGVVAKKNIKVDEALVTLPRGAARRPIEVRQHVEGPRRRVFRCGRSHRGAEDKELFDKGLFVARLLRSTSKPLRSGSAAS